MITYVNTVLVSNNETASFVSAAPAAASKMSTPSADAGKFVFMNLADDVASNAIYTIADTPKFRIGLVTKKNNAVRLPDGTTEYRPIVKWSNDIVKDDIKGITYQNKPVNAAEADTEDTVYINFENIDSEVVNDWNDGGKRIIVRLTFKDMPHRYRKWTESYEYVTKIGDTIADIVTAIANDINAQYKRARVEAKAVTITTTGSSVAVSTPASATDANAIQIVALPYDDDDEVNSLSWSNKVRFNANMYWTNPAAEGWESLNKSFPLGAVIIKEPGKRYVGMGKLVRDRENQAFGYQGIINRGPGTWPIIQPDMNTDIQKNYDTCTIEFENMYRAADDIFRKTKQTLEIYTAGANTNIVSLFTTLGISDKVKHEVIASTPTITAA